MKPVNLANHLDDVRTLRAIVAVFDAVALAADHAVLDWTGLSHLAQMGRDIAARADGTADALDTFGARALPAKKGGTT
jgi:hypothetical protein